MDGRQLLIDWDKRDRDLAVLEKHLRAVLREETDVQLLLWVAREDRRREDCSYVVTSKAEMAQAIGAQSRNTPCAVLRRLGEQGDKVLHSEITSAGHELLVDWIAVWRLSPRPTCEQRLRARAETIRSEAVRGQEIEGGQGLVRGGQTTPPRVLVQEHKPRVCTVSVSEDSAPRGLDARLVRPWSRDGGLTGEDLAWAVAKRSQYVLVRLWTEAIARGFWGDSQAYRQRFLACCWQAVASARTSAMGLLQTLCRTHLGEDQSRRESGEYSETRYTLSEAADQWASATRRQWNTPREYREARRAPRVEYVGVERD